MFCSPHTSLCTSLPFCLDTLNLSSSLLAVDEDREGRSGGGGRWGIFTNPGIDRTVPTAGFLAEALDRFARGILLDLSNSFFHVSS